MGLAFECVNADRIRLSGRGARRGELVSRRTSFPRLFPPLSISIPNSRHETSKESVRRGTKGDPTDKADPHGGRPFFLRVNPPISLHPRAFFLLLLRLLPSPSFLASRPSLFFFAPLESMAGESNEVVVYRPTGNSNPSHPSPLNIKLTSNRIEEPRPSNFSFCRSGSQSHRRREVNFVAAAQGTRYFMDVVI